MTGRYWLPRALREGDVIDRVSRAGVPLATYVVLGHTTRGKLRLRRESGTELTTWWTTILPANYKVRGLPGIGEIERLRADELAP